MPSYFYHLSLEVLSNSDIAAQTPLAIESACEALLPFQKRNRPSSSSGDANILRKHERREGGLIAHSSSQSSSSQASPGKPSRSRSAINTSSAPSNLLHDLRSSPISIQCIDMVTPEGGAMSRKKRAASGQEDNLVAAGIGTDILGGLRTKGRYIPLDQKVGDSVWGIVHLYRDAAETPYLASNDDDYPTHLKGSAAAVARPPGGEQLAFRPHVAGGASKSAGRDSADLAAYPFPVTASSSALIPDDDCSTLCVLAVPSYLSVSDFLGFVGERTLDDVSHFRMIRTPRANRYMVLMKFRSGRKAMEWQKEWNGKVFNSMEPETCHVVFVKSVEIQVVEPGDQSDYTPAETLPLSPSSSQPGGRHSTSTGQATLSTKPLAPPTPALIELPTCPVCLERMDETTGLLTIICQHVFHCTCLQKWKGSGCPVCRYTQDDLRRPITSDDSDAPPPECSVCNSDLNLWACLICGNIGCGRYDGAHAFDHWKQTSHAFAMDLTTQRVWDYVGDAYVHRIIQSKTDGKLVELPAADHSALDPDWADAVPREKLENMSVEYTHLLTSQLESQRAYFEEIVERAADKASQASAAASAAEEVASQASARLAEMQAKFDNLAVESIPGLEKDKARLEKRADKFEAMARALEKDYRAEKAMNENLMERVNALTTENEALKAQCQDLAEQNRDLTFFISSSQRLQGEGEDVVQGTVSVPEPEAKKKKNKGKGRK